MTGVQTCALPIFDPDQLDYIIPANYDAIRAIRLLCRLTADAAIEGAARRAERVASEPAPEIEIGEAETASDELIAAIAAGETFSFAPDEEELLPGGPVAEAAPAAPAEPGA